MPIHSRARRIQLRQRTDVERLTLELAVKQQVLTDDEHRYRVSARAHQSCCPKTPPDVQQVSLQLMETARDARDQSRRCVGIWEQELILALQREHQHRS